MSPAIITKGGTKTNIIPDETEMLLQVRAPIDSGVIALEGKVKACVIAAAAATGCTVSGQISVRSWWRHD